MTDPTKQWLLDMAALAKAAGHPFPEMAACEAGIDSAYGHSNLAKEANNLFGVRQRDPQVFETSEMPTREKKKDGTYQMNGNAGYIKYPTLLDCFADRITNITRLAPKYIHYAKALAAKDALEYVGQISRTWSNDPHRAANCAQVYHKYFGDLFVQDAVKEAEEKEAS
jgi:hypothetical protein